MSDFKPGSLDEIIESAIDKHGLAHVLTCLGNICGEKAEHIRANWQDKATARPWDKWGKRFDNLARERVEEE